MPTPIKVLILEDELTDAELMLSELRRANFSPDWCVVGTESAYEVQLDNDFDVILSNYSMRHLDALQALQILKERAQDIPFIVVTNAIGDEAGVECIKSGATDYLLKDRVALLGATVEKALDRFRLSKKDRRAVAVPESTEAKDIAYTKSMPDFEFLIIKEDGTYVELKSASDHSNKIKGAGSISELLPPQIAQSFIQCVSEVIQSGSSQTIEYRVESYDEAPEYEARFFAVGGDEVLVLVRDVTELMRKERIVSDGCGRPNASATNSSRATMNSVQRERIHGQEFLSAEIFHHLSNRLAPVLGLSEMLLANTNVLEDKAKVETYLEHIRAFAQRAADTIAPLRDFYLRGQSFEDLKRLDINEIMQKAASAIVQRCKDDPQLRFAPIAVETELGGLPLITASKADLQKAVSAIVDNALDAVNEGGTITLRTRFAEDRIVFEVSDNGVGMTTAVQQRCFEPFFTTKSDFGATGMGLAVAHGIIQRHRGSIEVESEQSKGTTLTCNLPLAEGSQVSQNR